ncbi:MAG: phytanoyl-CoA dioxygenase [Cuspidothrix sp.]
MLNNITEKISVLKEELEYHLKLWQHQNYLPILEGKDKIIAESLKRDGVCITSLDELGLPSTSELLKAANIFLPKMGKDNYESLGQNHPEIFNVTHLNEFLDWGKESRLLNILENYIGLPVAYHGVQIRKDFINKNQFKTMMWHRDSEDRRIVKIIIYLNDVDKEQGPFQYAPSAFTSGVNFYRLYHKIYNQGLDDESFNQIVPKSVWKSCTGPAGTVIIADTNRLLHHGTVRTKERSTLFFAYTANPPKRPGLCTQYWDDTFPKADLSPELN